MLFPPQFRMEAREEPAESSESSMLLQLPDHLLCHVLQQLRLDCQSVCSAARAHSRLHKAAVAAMSSICAKGKHAADSLQQYLTRHGDKVSNVSAQHVVFRVACYKEDLPQLRQQLPICNRLEVLSLQDCQVQLAASATGRPGLLQAAPQLTKLHFQNCILHDTTVSLKAVLQQLPHLQHLAAAYSVYGPFADGVLQGLTGLTYLSLHGLTSTCCSASDRRSHCGWSATSKPIQLEHIRSMKQLRGLKLNNFDEHVSAETFSGLEHLTLLQLTHDNRPITLYFNGDQPGLRLVDVSALGHLTQLQHLVLQLVIPCSRFGTHVTDAATEVSMDCLLAAVDKLTQLTYLQLSGAASHHEVLQYSTPENLYTCVGGMRSKRPRTGSAPSYSALSASSRLQRLKLPWFPLPPSAWQHAFAAGRKLLQLQDLTIAGISSEVTSPVDDMAGLVSCCPNLQRLNLDASVYHWGLRGRQLEPLKALTHLTELTVTYNVPHLRSAAIGLAQLTGLQSLTIHTVGCPQSRMAVSKTEAALLQLTQLRQLTCLRHLMQENPKGLGLPRPVFELKVRVS